MALGTTNLSLKDSLYAEMGKDTGGSNYSLGQCKFGQNDIDISAYANSNPSKVNMSFWQSYDHMNLKFRFNGNQTMESDTYADTISATGFANGAGVPWVNNGATTSTNWFEFDGGSGQGKFYEVASGEAYKVGASGTSVIAFWVQPQDNGQGQTTILGNDVPYGTVSSYRGYRFDLTTAMKIRVIRGDGTGVASSDRRTFESSGTLDQNGWNFVVWQGVYNSTTVGTTTNYFWIYRRDTGSWSNGASFLSGTGGNLSYGGATDGLAISGANNGGYYFQGYVGGIYAFNQSMTTTDVETLWTNTRGVYV